MSKSGNSRKPGDITRKAFLAIPYRYFDYPSPESALAALQKLPPGQRAICAIVIFTTEYYNGGLSQFFRNGTGFLASETVNGLETVGAPEFASVVRSAMAVLGPDYPLDPKTRWARLKPLIVDDEIGIPSLSALGEQWRAFNRSPLDLDSITDEYVRQHLGEFFPGRA